MLRFAPSPTGLLHIGNLRVALLNYLFAKKNNIKFFLRIDDTDLERSSQKYTEAIISDLEWLNIDYFDIFKQSERMKKYIDVFNFLKRKEFIYPCFESAEELSLKRKILLKQGKPPIYDRSSLKLKKSEISSLISSGKKPHWRLKLNDELITWEDHIHNKVIFKNLSISDPVIFRSDELPLFTITSVVDDADLNVTHIMRGDDHLTNTAAQIQLFKMLDSKIPEFGHFPLIKSISGEGLSKRTGKNSINQLRSDNILPIIIINYLSKIGSSKSIDNILDKEKLIDEFDLKIFSKNSIFFDLNELLRLNSRYLKELSFKELKKTSNPHFNESFWEVIKSNINSIEEAKDWYEIINSQLILEDKVKLNNDLKKIILAELPEKIVLNTWVDWTKKILEKCDIKPKELYTKLRIILTGKQFGPSMNNLLTLLNVKEIVDRIKVNSE